MYLLVLASFEGFVPGVCYVRLYGQTAVFQDCTETSMSHFPVGTCLIFLITFRLKTPYFCCSDLADLSQTHLNLLPGL